MNFIVASQILLWLAVLALSLVCLVLARQIGVLHLRLAPAGALALPQSLKTGDLAPQLALTSLDGSTVAIGGLRGGRSQLLLFVSPDCSVCAALLPAIRSAQGAERGWLDIVLAGDGDPDEHRAFVLDKDLGKFPYVLSELLGRSYGVAKLPYAVLIDEAGKMSAAGLCNTREHLESLFLAKESGISSIQQYLAREPKRAAGE